MNFDTIIKYLPWLLKAGQTVPEVIAFVNQIKADFEQKGEWTPAADQLYRDSLDALAADPDFQPDPVP